MQKFTELCGRVPNNRAGHIQKMHRPMRLGWNHMGLLCACMACIWERQKAGCGCLRSVHGFQADLSQPPMGLGPVGVTCFGKRRKIVARHRSPAPTSWLWRRWTKNSTGLAVRGRWRRERRGESEERESERRILRRSVSFRGGLKFPGSLPTTGFAALCLPLCPLFL